MPKKCQAKLYFQRTIKVRSGGRMKTNIKARHGSHTRNPRTQRGRCRKMRVGLKSELWASSYIRRPCLKKNKKKDKVRNFYPK